jgi:esterase/lipase
MESFFFGKSPKKLFGNYHPPERSIKRDTGIVLCYPIGQEYVRSHRSFLRLANLLAGQGFHVLRFDYYGCGDSMGMMIDADIDQWLEDISTAIEELKYGCDLNRICLIGFRLGATFALMTGKNRDDITGIGLWDLVSNGNVYIEEMKRIHMQWQRGSFAKQKQNENKYLEILGFPFTETLIRQIKNINVHLYKQKAAGHIIQIESVNKEKNEEIINQIKKNTLSYHYEFLENNIFWFVNSDEGSKGVVPLQILQSIVKWTCEVFQ